VNSFTAQFVYHFDTIDVKYVGGAQEYKYDFYGDTDGTDVLSYQIPLAPGSICGTVGSLFAAGAVSGQLLTPDRQRQQRVSLLRVSEVV
jgi:iron complex outermembrane recepter protein